MTIGIAPTAKPVIRWSAGTQRWVCSGLSYFDSPIEADADTPRAAFSAWCLEAVRRAMVRA